MSIEDLYFSEQEFGIERDREIVDQYMQQLDEQAERHFYELSVEM